MSSTVASAPGGDSGAEVPPNFGRELTPTVSSRPKFRAPGNRLRCHCVQRSMGAKKTVAESTSEKATGMKTTGTNVTGTNATRTKAWTDAADIFASQDGVATLDQLRATGLSDPMIRGRVSAGELTRPGRGLLLTRHHPHTDRTGVRIGVMLAGGVADRKTALFWHRFLDEAPTTTTVTVPQEHRVRKTGGYEISARRRWLDPADIVEVDGLNVTGMPLSVLEVCDPKVMDRALQKKLVTLDEMEASLKRNKGARGIVDAKAVFAIAAGDTESEAERIFAELLQVHGIIGWHAQLPFRGWAIDFAFPEAKLAVEINGWAFHRSQSRWMRDQNKSNALTSAGWSVLNFSWHHLTDAPEDVITTVAETLGTCAA